MGERAGREYWVREREEDIGREREETLWGIMREAAQDIPEVGI